jgi:hypothetical protein
MIEARQRIPTRIGQASPRLETYRFLAHYDDGGSGMRARDEPLRRGDVLFDGGTDYVVEPVEPEPNPMSFGHAWAARIDDA